MNRLLRKKYSMKFSKKNQELIKMYKKISLEGYEKFYEDEIDNTFSKFGIYKFRDYLQPIFSDFSIQTVLDYGSGGSDWYSSGFDKETNKSAIDFFSLKKTFCYEPARDIDERAMADCVISFDVLEHIFIYDVPNLLRDIFRFSKKLVVLNIACYSANAKLPNGENAHITIRPPNWWKGMVDSISIEYSAAKKVLLSTRDVFVLPNSFHWACV